MRKMSLLTALIAAVMMCVTVPGLVGAATSEGSAVTFKDVSIGPDPIPEDAPVEVEVTVESETTPDSVQIFYCNDDQCKLPIDMKDQGSGRYTFTIYAEGTAPTVEDAEYEVTANEVWVKIGVKVGNDTYYYPTEETEGYDEGYIKLPLDSGSDGTSDGGDGEDGGDGGSKDGEDEDTPGFGAILVLAALLGVTGAVMFLGRRRK